MEAWVITLITVGILSLILIICLSRRKKSKQPKKTIQAYLNYNDFLSAGSLYLDQENYIEAADLYFKIPPEKKPGYEAMLLEKLGTQNIQSFWMRAARNFEKNNPEKASIAFLLSGAYFDAIKMFIDRNEIMKSVEVVNHIPVNLQEGIVRRLSQYAFDRGKHSIAADLLRSIGFVDEADAILAVAAHELGVIERPAEAAAIYKSVGREDLAGVSQERQGELALSEGKIEVAKIAFEKAVKAYDDSNQPKEALRIEGRLKKFHLLDKFRNYIANGDLEFAEKMIPEVSSSFPGIAIADLYGEIAAILEKNKRITEAITYYDKAADATNNPLKKQGYVNALRRIGSQVAMQKSQGEKVAKQDLSDKCIVCKRAINAGESYIRCPSCKKFAHYTHLIEFVKVQGFCPNCKTKLKADDLKLD